MLEASGCVIGLVETAKRGDAKALASTAARAYFDLVVAAGGDGTIAEVINGLARRDGETLEARPGLAVLPLGTANVLAHELGLPRGARAVARACASNPAALAVPCHRVVGADGALRGYRWGTERKRSLLEAEKESDLSLSSGKLASPNGRDRRRSAA